MLRPSSTASILELMLQNPVPNQAVIADRGLDIYGFFQAFSSVKRIKPKA